MCPPSSSTPSLTRIVEFTSLANGKTTTSNDQHLLYINEVLTSSDCSTFEVGFGIWCDFGIAGGITELGEAVQ